MTNPLKFLPNQRIYKSQGHFSQCSDLVLSLCSSTLFILPYYSDFTLV